MFQSMPKVALAPLIIVWFGLGLTSKVINAALVAFFPLMVNTIVGLRSADEDRINLMRSLAATRSQIFWMLQLPNALPYIFAGLEIAMIFALIGAIVAEFVGAQAGLGMLIQSMNFTMDVAGQFSVLLILSMVGLFSNSGHGKCAGVCCSGIRRRSKPCPREPENAAPRLRHPRAGRTRRGCGLKGEPPMQKQFTAALLLVAAGAFTAPAQARTPSASAGARAR